MTKTVDDAITNIYAASGQVTDLGADRSQTSGAPTRFLTGNLDEVSLCSTALNDSQIATLASAVSDPDASPCGANLQAHWRMGDGDTHPNLLDVSGNSNTMVMQNMESDDIELDVP